MKWSSDKLPGLFSALFYLAIFSTGIFLIYTGPPADHSVRELARFLIGMVLFLPWCITPFLICRYFFNRARHKSGFLLQSIWIVAIAGVLIVSLWGYYDVFYVHTDPQSALALIFFPLWFNLLLGGAGAVLEFLFSRIWRVK